MVWLAVVATIALSSSSLQDAGTDDLESLFEAAHSRTAAADMKSPPRVKATRWVEVRGPMHGLQLHSERRILPQLSEATHNEEAPAYLMELLLCWRAVASVAGIEWVLAAGTLLGAIRAGNIIPWDGDVDIAIAGTKEWERVYPLWLQDVTKLRSIAAKRDECKRSRIIFPSESNSAMSPYVTARVVWSDNPKRQVDITAPYVGNYSKNTPEFEKALQQYGFDYKFEDTRCVKGCPWFISTKCSSYDAYVDHSVAQPPVDPKCAAFVDHFMMPPRPCTLGGQQFLCAARAEDLLVGDYGPDWRTPMYSTYSGGTWHN